MMPDSSRFETRRAEVLLIAASFMWGSSFVGSKICLNAGLLPFETVFYRMAVGVALLGIVFHKQLRRFSKAALLTGILLGVVTSGIYSLEMYGISMTEATKAAFLTSTNIVMMPFLYAAFFHVRPQPRSIAAAVLALGGVWCLNCVRGGLSLGPGDLLLLGTAFLYAINSITVAKLGKDCPAVQITFLQLLTTLVFTGVMMQFQGCSGSYPVEAVGALLYLAIGPTLICFLIKNYAVQRISPVTCTLILATEGIFCALLSMVLLRERLTLSMCAGILLILCGIITEELGTAVWTYAMRKWKRLAEPGVCEKK